MRIENSAVVPATPDLVFALLNDVDRIAGCMPGARLLDSDGDLHRGTMTIKIGPITASYEGSVRFSVVDAAARTITLTASGADSRGNGDAEANVDISVHDDAMGARLDIVSDVLIRGKIAQFGKGAVAAVAERLMTQFTTNMTALLVEAPISHLVEHDPGRLTSATPAAAPVALDGLALLLPAAARRRLAAAALLAFGFLQGYLFGRFRKVERLPHPSD